jgi:hypothetical protein
MEPRPVSGPFTRHLVIYAGMRPAERIEVLLALFGSQQRAVMGRNDVEAV